MILNSTKMNSISLGLYYLNNIDEFTGEKGHEKLLQVLKKHIGVITGTNVLGLDIGACIGKYLHNIRDICFETNSQLLCFEPNPVNIPRLRNKLRDNDHLFECCLSNYTGVSPFYNWKDCATNFETNSLAGLRGGGHKICDVGVFTLEDLLNAEYMNTDFVIKFVKIDTEGNDGNVLKGFGHYLSITHYIVFECSDCLDDIRGPNIEQPMKDIVNFLSSNGFDTYRIGTHKLIKVNDEYWNDVYEDYKTWSNCFALKKGDPIIHKIIDCNFDYIG
jgi:FkbM family methyltransferase